MKKVDIYTDGACSYNPGPGGYGAVLIYNGAEKEVCGYNNDTTNNRMELFAVIAAVRALKEPCELKIYSDSAYVVNAFEKHWLDEWQKDGWSAAAKKNILNVDLWKSLLLELKRHKYVFVKVKGHSDNEYNNRCDVLARGEIKKYMERIKAAPHENAADNTTENTKIERE
ncbi:MAG: ribonuclease HI [Clostridiales bacterium]|jgi:ribonuclease HI|nr:ribonuclease HI [Clostridiales bacterium]